MKSGQPAAPSLYEADARPAPEVRPLPGPRRADVLVIGAGFTGLSTALHLAERGAEVVAIDANRPGWGASGRNGGQVNPGLRLDPDQVEADWGEDRGGRLVRFAWGAPAATFELIRRLGIECDARQGGTLRAAYGRAHAEAVRRSAEQGLRRGLPVELLDREASRAATGTDRYLAILRDATGGDLQPLDYAGGLARAAMGAGANVHGGTVATRLRRAGGGWEVETPLGAITADTVVLAANGYTDDLLPALRRSVAPVFSSIIATEPLPPDVAAGVMPAGSVAYEVGHVTTYYRLDQARRLLIGGRGPQRPILGPGPMSFLMRYAERLWPALRTARWTHGWNGQLALTADHYPHVHRPAPGLIACLGYNGRGVALSTVLGAEIAGLALGADPADLSVPVTPVRPMAFHGFWRLGVAARVLEGRLRDRFGL